MKRFIISFFIFFDRTFTFSDGEEIDLSCVGTAFEERALAGDVYATAT